MKYAATTAAAMLLGSASLAMAQEESEEVETEATATPAAQSEENDPETSENDNDVVCRTERVTGSLTRRNRICMTRAEWRELEGNTREALDRYQSRAGRTND